MSRRVVLLGPYPPPYGGVSIYIKTLFERLKHRGVELWTFGASPFSDTNVFFMKDKRWELLPLLLRRGANARIADCSHFLIEYPSFLVPVWVILKRFLGFDWLKIMQDGSLPSRYPSFNPIRKELFRVGTEAVTEFIVISEELEHWLRHEIGVKQKVTLIKNLFPISYRTTTTSFPAAMEKTLNAYENHAKRVCSIGVFIPSYGFKHVADAIEKIREDKDVDIGLVLLDGDFADETRYRAEVLRRRPWITVLKNVPHPLVFEILRRSHVFVRAFGLDSYGLSRVEAILSGLPVVATRAGETRGMLLYDFGNVQELTNQLKLALFTDQTRDTEKWAAVYQEEAKENLRALVDKLMSES